MAGLGLTAMLLVGVAPVGAAPGDLDTTTVVPTTSTTTTVAPATTSTTTTVVPTTTTTTTVAAVTMTTLSPVRGMVPPRPVYIG